MLVCIGIVGLCSVAFEFDLAVRILHLEDFRDRRLRLDVLDLRLDSCGCGRLGLGGLERREALFGGSSPPSGTTSVFTSTSTSSKSSIGTE